MGGNDGEKAPNVCDVAVISAVVWTCLAASAAGTAGPALALAGAPCESVGAQINHTKNEYRKKV